MQTLLMCFLLPTFAPLERERERKRATVCILHHGGAIALGIRVSLVDELLGLYHLVQSLLPLSALILLRIQCMRIASPCVTSSPLLCLSPPHPSFFLHNTCSLPLASSSSDAAEQTCVVDSGSHPKRTREGAAAAAAFPVVEFCNSVRKKKKQRLGSDFFRFRGSRGRSSVDCSCGIRVGVPVVLRIYNVITAQSIVWP